MNAKPFPDLLKVQALFGVTFGSFMVLYLEFSPLGSNLIRATHPGEPEDERPTLEDDCDRYLLNEGSRPTVFEYLLGIATRIAIACID
jgi:hypothetical protein